MRWVCACSLLQTGRRNIRHCRTGGIRYWSPKAPPSSVPEALTYCGLTTTVRLVWLAVFAAQRRTRASCKSFRQAGQLRCSKIQGRKHCQQNAWQQSVTTGPRPSTCRHGIRFPDGPSYRHSDRKIGVLAVFSSIFNFAKKII